jgi:hypothetical protein
MKRRQILTTAFLLLFFSCGYGQTTSKLGYKIDSNISDQLYKQTNSTSGVSMGKMEIKMFEYDSLIIDTYDKDKKIEFFTMTSLVNDTVHIVGFAGMFTGFGFYLDIYKDDYKITYLAKSDAEIYKYSKADTTLTFGLSVPCSETSLTLISKPTFKLDDIIAGIVELKSLDFWEVSNWREEKYRIELRAYFTTGKIEIK